MKKINIVLYNFLMAIFLPFVVLAIEINFLILYKGIFSFDFWNIFWITFSVVALIWIVYLIFKYFKIGRFKIYDWEISLYFSFLIISFVATQLNPFNLIYFNSPEAFTSIMIFTPFLSFSVFSGMIFFSRLLFSRNRKWTRIIYYSFLYCILVGFLVSVLLDSVWLSLLG